MFAKRVEGRFLAVGIERRRLGRHDEDGPLAFAVEPHVEEFLRLLRRLPGFGEFQHFQRRIARDQRLERAPRGRGEILQSLDQLLVKVRRIEFRGVQRRREQVAIGQQRIWNRLQ